MDIQVQSVSNAFESIATANGHPTELNTDAGVAFANAPVQEMRRRLNITHRIKEGGERISPSSIEGFNSSRKGLFKYTANKQTGDWESRVDKAVGTFNHTGTDPLMGSDPNDVEKEPGL
ncbi:hypothetical protein N9L68_03800 [bacterium]|nr:hypothetical protein [bacterium]